MTATATDYLWFQQRFPELATAYCITLVKDLMPSALAAFALAEELTGVQLTPALLERTTFVCGVCPPSPVRRVWPAELRS